MPIQTQTIAPFSDGMNVQDEPWAIDDTQCRFAQDVLFDKPNMARRRGPVKEAVTFSGQTTNNGSPTYLNAIGLFGTEQPNGVFRVGALVGDGSNARLTVWNTDFLGIRNVLWTTNQNFNPANRYPTASSAHPWGGVYIGTQTGVLSGAETIGHWAGADKTMYNTGTITVGQDDKTVTGSGTSWLANIVPGMFLYANSDVIAGSGFTFLGIVKTVNTDTSLTLIEGSLFAVTGKNYRLQSRRPISRRVAKGTITVTAGQKKVVGAGTKFKRQGLDTPTGTGKWAIFEADDYRFIGLVNAVQSDIQLTLVAGATRTLNKSKFVAIDAYDDNGTNDEIVIANAKDPGWMTARYANRQWYGNRAISNRAQPHSNARVWFSDIIDPEALDVTGDGDHILIPSKQAPVRPLTGIIGLSSALVCFKEDETYAVVGTDETNFAVRKILDDGCISPNAFQAYKDGVIFAGKKGIWYFDGSETFNLIEDNLKDYYGKSLQTFNRVHGAWSMTHRDHYFVYIDSATPPFGPVKEAGATDTTGTPTKYLALAINLETLAASTLTNFAFHGAVDPPFEEAYGTFYIVNTLDGSNNLAGSRLCQADDLFTAKGVDTLKTATRQPTFSQKGPDFYIETKRYDIGDPQTKKRVKQLQMIYRLESTAGTYVTDGNQAGSDYTNNKLKFAYISGVNDFSTIGTDFPLTRTVEAGVGKPGRVNKKNKAKVKSSHVGFKFWQNNLTTIKNVEIGPLAIGFKWLRPGKV